MFDLIVFEQNGRLFTDSREVAKTIECRHSDLLEKIDSYIKYLADGDFRSQDYFVNSSYIDTQGKERPCFQCTKIGCDMIANKLQGKRFELRMSARNFNVLLKKQGYLEERTRKSTKSPAKLKKYNALTEKGLKYGENAVSPQCQREVQPIYFVDTFAELFNTVVYKEVA